MAIIFIVLLLAGPFAILFGESRYDDRDRRRWWPGTR